MGGSKSSASSSSVVVSPDALRLVYAFLYTHAKPKLASKLADQYPKLNLEENASQAEELSNALVNTVTSALAVSNSEIARVLSGEKKKARKSEEKESKKSKKAKKNNDVSAPVAENPDMANDSAMQVDATEAPAPAPPAPETVTEVSVTESQPTGETVVTKTVQAEAPQPSKKTKTSGERFQRVKSDQVTFLDDRLRDMSYAAKVSDTLMQSGAGDYGARANADLIVTQGKAFTKEKNKKKRGSYRGGIIDQGSHSIKFTYDDE
ncbi:jun-like transcription factor [Malassezia brasiliensis]|uniref:Jun-like transcription factor n=1 Tax=Malassezia brasiliensis TaxID=1821822 RepID=A0AAF0DVM2_9BASI|nr:jun-like transcription factor [Malassezia brasiliensis]